MQSTGIAWLYCGGVMSLEYIRNKHGLFIKEIGLNKWVIVEYIENDMRSLRRITYQHSNVFRNYGLAIIELESMVKQLETKVG
jgi:hypothetical protein